jgi:hypothetical protein
MTERRKTPRFKKIYWLYFILIEIILAVDIFAHADTIVKQSTPFTDTDYLIKGLLGIASFFIIRFMYRIDKNQGILFEQNKDLNGRLSNLEGSHKAYTEIGKLHG